MNPKFKLLSKTKLLRGYRCLKCIYLTVHHPELESPITPDIQALFDQGNHVGAYARHFFPGGVLVDNMPWDFSGALAKTRLLLATGVETIYEAAFEYMGCYARADIINYSPETKRFRIYEVKSTTKVKPEHLDDIGLQTWIMAKSGLPIEQINLLHLNPECRYPDLSNLFKEHDVTQEMREKYLTVQPKITELFTTLRQSTVPDIDIGPYCHEPTECGFIDHCWKAIPTPSVFNLPGIKDRKWELYYEDILTLDNPLLTDLSELQHRMVEAYRTGERYVNREGIKNALANWQFPFVFLDFETINPAIPRYPGTGPFHHVPFQFSVHIWQHPDADIIHKEFLHDTTEDPRSLLIPALLEACGVQGSIIAYYGKFEAARIKELAEFSNMHRESLLSLIDRIIDPLPIIREYVYDNAFGGSFSLKSVAPALLGESQRYEGMLVANGGDAQRAFEELISPDTPDMRKQLLRHAMIEYCKKDTFVMVELVKWLREQIQ